MQSFLSTLRLGPLGSVFSLVLVAGLVASCGKAKIELGDGCGDITGDGNTYTCVLSAKNLKGKGDYAWKVSDVTGDSACAENGWTHANFAVSGDNTGESVTYKVNNLDMSRANDKDTKCSYSVNVERKNGGDGDDKDKSADSADASVDAVLPKAASS